MRHPAAPIVIAFLFGFLAFMLLWSRVRSDGHHEGNPHPDDVPRKHEEHVERTLDGSDDDDHNDDYHDVEDRTGKF